MKIVVKIFLLCMVVWTVANAQNQINAMRVPGNISTIGPHSRAWLSAEYTDVLLYPHTALKTVHSHIDTANEKVKKVRVKAIYNAKDIAFLFEWKDTTKNSDESCCPSLHKDGFALQFPKNYSDATKLPYISMGNKHRPVIVHLQNASDKMDTQDGSDEYFDAFHTSKKQYQSELGSAFIMEGSASIHEIKSNTTPAMMGLVYENGAWKGTLLRALKTENLDLRDGAFAVSFVVWDGSFENADGIEHLSTWVGVKLVGERGGDALLDALKSSPKGDIENGKRLAIANCVACHNFTGASKTLANIAPDLSNIGGYATPQYIKESMLETSAVVVQNNTIVEEDFPWYSVNENGEIISTMPSYNWMDEKSINDLVTYFSSLRVEIEQEGVFDE